MYAKKGISPVMATVIILVFLIFVLIVFSGFVSGGSLQIKSLFQRQISATGEIPCTRSPTVTIQEDVGGAVYINTSKVAADTLKKRATVVPAQFKATISSSCLENLTIRWNFGDNQGIDTECSYITGKGYATWNASGKDWTNENCTIINHTYILQSVNDIWTIKDISVSAFGGRSGFYAEASTNGFVLDPYFSINVQTPITNNYNCIGLNGAAYSTKGTVSLDQLSLDVVDNRKLISVDQVKNGALSYRAPSGTTHTVQVLATKGYQTAKSAAWQYQAPFVSNPPEEIAVFGKTNLNIYTTASKVYDFNGEFFPKKIGNPTDMAVGKLSGDNAGADFVFLTTEGGKGSIFAQSYSDLQSSLSQSLSEAEAGYVKLLWPYHDLDDLTSTVYDYCGWVAVAAGNNIKSSDGSKTGNIVVLGNPGDLDLYNYAGGQITLVERGKELNPDSEVGAWQDVTTADLDKDGEDEIIALFGASYVNHENGDLFIFKYEDYKRVDNKEEFNCKGNPAYKASDPCWVDILNMPVLYKWVAVAAGQMDADKETTEIVAVGVPGDLVKMSYDYRTTTIKIFGYLEKRGWPNVDWRDVTTIDYYHNNDGINELAFLYKDGDKYYAAIISYNDTIFNVDNDNFDDFKAKAIKITELSSSTDWQAITAGDIACFL